MKGSSGCLRSNLKRGYFPEQEAEKLKRYKRHENSNPPPEQLDQEVSWTETQMVVEEASLYSEKLVEGKISYSIRLELVEEPESSSNTRNRTVIQLALGLEEKDIPTFARLLGRKVFFHHERPVESLEREQLVIQLKEAMEKNASLSRKITYLNDSLHHYVQESR